MDKFLITGGAGFIGSNIADRLLEQGHSVRVIDNFLTGKRENLSKALSSQRFELIEGDIRNLDTVRRACEGIDFVLHEAAIPSVPRSIDDPIATNEVNINGTLNVLKASYENKVRRVVYAASSSAYGDTAVLPKKEDMIPSPLSPYAVSKLTGEYYCRVFTSVYGLETVSLRYFNIFGPRQDPNSTYAAVVPRFITALLKGESPTVYGDGEQSRDFTYIENVIHANINACYAPPAAAGRVLNIACGTRFTLNTVLRKLEEIFDKKANPKYLPAKKGDVKHSQADITNAANYIQYKIEVDFETGLRRTVDYFALIV
ncbi:MAG: SDR family oxidoreductase [Deltaproteobacteria bacterium]|nr:SDR family oxidoreductase [Deltaproteobacteria bacterium]